MQNRSSDIKNHWLVMAVGAMVLVPALAAGGISGGRPNSPNGVRATNNSSHGTVVVPVHSTPNGYGRYGELSAQFWQWEFSLPVPNHPLFTEGAVDCRLGQSGAVWFLGGTVSPTPIGSETSPGVAVRSCVIPEGKSLFFPIVNAECSSVPGDNLGDTTVAGLRECATFFANFINSSTLSASVDGEPVANLAEYRVQSPPFPFGPVPAQNIFQFFSLDAPAGTRAHSVSDGVYLLLKPLAPGAHTIKFYGELVYGPGNTVVQDITYHITVM